MSAAVAIKRAATNRDAVAFQVALGEAQQILNANSFTEDDRETSLADEVQRKVSLWSGLCKVEVTIDSSVSDIRGRTARDVGRVVEEGLSNAILHGGATSIAISMAIENGTIIVIVNDNGCGPQRGERGLGSAVLDGLSDSWELSAVPSGSRLRVPISR